MKLRSLLFIAAIVSIATGQQAHAAGPAKVKFGALMALSGPAAPWGIPLVRSFELSAEEINKQGGFTVKGKTYEWDIITYDHKYVPAEAVKAANKAIYSDQVKFMTVMGGSPCLAVIPLMKENNILSLNIASGGKKVTNPDNPLVFRYNASVEIMYLSVLPYLVKNEGIKTMATITPDDATGHSGLDAAKLGASHSNVEIIAAEFFERGSKDFTSLLTRVIAKKPDLIETCVTDPTSASLILKQAREQGYKGIFLLSWGTVPEQVLKIAGPHAENAFMYVSAPFKPENDYQKRVYEAFVKKWGEKNWNNVIYMAYGLVPALTDAIVVAQSFEPEAVANKLESLEWETPTGNLSFGGTKLLGVKRELLYKGAFYQFRKGTPAFLGILDYPAEALD